MFWFAVVVLAVVGIQVFSFLWYLQIENELWPVGSLKNAFCNVEIAIIPTGTLHSPLHFGVSARANFPVLLHSFLFTTFIKFVYQI